VIPLSKGGNDTIENVRPAHAICNLRKGSRL
jgi:5-methylcytosine-specific restriction endonuclease McrA